MDKITLEFLKKRPLSYSSMKAFRKSPLHYMHYLSTPYEPKPAQIEGKYLDCLLLEPDQVEKRFLVYEPFEKRSNAAKEKWRELEESAASTGRTLISSDVTIDAKKAVAEIKKNPDVFNMLDNIKAVQIPLRWTDKQTGIPLIGYADFETDFYNIDSVVDLKKTTSADPDDIHRDIFKYGYHLQAATYKEGYWKSKYRFPEFFILAVEINEPYGVSINYFDSKVMEEAEAEFRGTLLAFKKWIDDGAEVKGYEFKRMDLSSYFRIDRPGYYKPKFIGFEI